MAIQTFTSGQVLTAAQVNALNSNDFNQTVTTKTANATLVAADKGTRVVMNVSSASTVTVNTSIFSAGDTLVIQNIASNATVVTAGTATVSTAGSLSIPQFGSGTLFFTSASAAIFFPSAGPAASSGLTFVGGGTLSGAATTFSNVFSASFDNYLVNIANANEASNAVLQATIGAITTGYVEAHPFNYAAFSYSASQSFWHWGFCGTSGSENVSTQFTLFSPFLTSKKSGFGKHLFPSNQLYDLFATNSNTTSCTSLTLTSSQASFLGGTVKIYGYQNS